MSRQSWGRLGIGTRCAMVTGTSTASAMESRNAEKVTGGTSRTQSLMNNHTVLQMAHVTTQTTRNDAVTSERL